MGRRRVQKLIRRPGQLVQLDVIHKMSEPDVANTSTPDVKKLIRVRGAHKGAFTKLEYKIDPFIQSNIGTDDELIQAEALSSNLKTKIQVIYSYDAQIELLGEDEADLDTEMITSTDFHHLADVAVARLSEIIDNYKKPSTVTPVASYNQHLHRQLHQPANLGYPNCSCLPLQARIQIGCPSSTYSVLQLIKTLN